MKNILNEVEICCYYKLLFVYIYFDFDRCMNTKWLTIKIYIFQPMMFMFGIIFIQFNFSQFWEQYFNTKTFSEILQKNESFYEENMKIHNILWTLDICSVTFSILFIAGKKIYRTLGFSVEKFKVFEFFFIRSNNVPQTCFACCIISSLKVVC